MASYTTNLNLKKPAGSENVAIGDINGNMDTIDTAVGNLKNQVSYTGSDGLVINRVGRLAAIVSLPTVTTQSGNAKISTITDPKFRPTSVISIASQVYNGSAYVDCMLEIQTTGEVNIYSISGGATAGYQAQYLKCKGFAYICNGN